MKPIEWIKKHRNFLFAIFSLLVFFLYILLFNVDIVTIANYIAQMNFLLFLLALIIGLLSIFFFALSWNVLLSFLKIGISFWKSLLYVLYGFYMDFVVPAGAVTGDIARIYLIGKDREDKAQAETKALASVLTQRVLGMFLNVIALILGLTLVFIGTQFDRTVIYYVTLVGGLILAGLGFIFVLIAKKSLSIRIIDGSLAFVDNITKRKWNVSKFKNQVSGLVEIFQGSMDTYRHNPKVLAVSMGYLLLNWVCSFCVLYVVFFSLGYPVSFFVVIVTASIVAAIRAIPVGIPFEVGIPEITMTTLFIALGVPAGVSATATLLSRAVTLWFIFILGFIAQQWLALGEKKIDFRSVSSKGWYNKSRSAFG
jgi:uncharacterized protein (TIRG00374 family)